MKRIEIQEIILEAISEVLIIDKETISLADDLEKTLGADSTDISEMWRFLEDDFEMLIDDDVISSTTTVSTIIDTWESALSDKDSE